MNWRQRYIWLIKGNNGIYGTRRGGTKCRGHLVLPKITSYRIFWMYEYIFKLLRNKVTKLSYLDPRNCISISLMLHQQFKLEFESNVCSASFSAS